MILIVKVFLTINRLINR